MVELESILDGQNDNQAAPDYNDILPKKPELQKPQARRQKSTSFANEGGAAAAYGGRPLEKV